LRRSTRLRAKPAGHAGGSGLKQAAIADRILLTKNDLVPPEQRSRLAARLHALNPAAPIVIATNGKVEPGLLFDAGLYNPETLID